MYIFPSLLLVLVAMSPLSALAQNGPSLQSWLTNFITFADTILIPFILGIGFLIFVINAIRYFVVESTEEDGREKAKALAIWSVLGFVLLVSFWGIVNLLSSSIGLNRTTPVSPDYLGEKGACAQGSALDENGSVCPGRLAPLDVKPFDPNDIPVQEVPTIKPEFDGGPMPFDPGDIPVQEVPIITTDGSEAPAPGQAPKGASGGASI